MSLTVEGRELVIHMSKLEKVAAVHGDVRIPVSAVEGVEAVDNPYGEIRGIKFGTGIPGVAVYGARITTSGKDFVAVHGHGPGVRVDLNGTSPYERLVVSVDDPDAVVAAVRAAMGPGGSAGQG